MLPGETFGSSGSETQDSLDSELLSDDLAKSEVAGSEVVAPVTHAVSLVNTHEC